MIHYQVIGRGSARLNNFTGTCVYDLKEAIEAKEQLPSPASLLILSIKKISSEEIEDLDELEASTEDDVFDLTTLCSEYGIKRRNPISVVLPGKRLGFPFLTTHIC